MATLVNDRPGLGAAFGTGLSSSLNALADAKIKQMIEAPMQKNLADLISRIGGVQQTPQGENNPLQAQQQVQQQRTPGGLTPEELNQVLRTLPVDKQKFVLDAYQKQRDFDVQEQARQEKQRVGTRDYNLKLSQDAIKEWRDRADTSKKNIDTYERIIAAAQKGNLRAGLQNQILTKIGLQGFNQNIDTQLAQADMSQLAQGAGSAFNTRRLTNLEVGTYKNSLVTLWNTPEGIVAISKNRILEDKANIAKYEARRKYLKEHKGELPLDWEDEAEDKYASKELKALSQEALDNVQNAGTKSGKKKSSIDQEPESSERTPFQEKADTVERHLLRTGARVGESLLGLPGDIASLGLGAANYLSGGAIPNYEQIQEKLPVSLPTSQQNREFLRKHTGDYLEPQGKIEEFADEVASDLSTLLLPVKGKIPFKAALGRALGANAASFFTKELGGGPLAQAGAKLGVSLLAGLPSMRGKLETTMNEGYDAARKSSARGTANTSNLSSRARKIYDAATKGDSPNKDFIKERARAVERIADTGKASIADLTTLKQDLNRQVRENANNLSKSDKRIIGSLLDEVHGLLDKYGRQNKTFGENFRQAEDICRGLNAQSYATEVLDKYLTPTNLKNPVVKSILYGAGAFHNPATAIKIAGSSLGAREIAKTFDLFKNSKEARKYYQEFIEQALKNHGPAAARAAVKLDEAAQDYFE